MSSTNKTTNYNLSQFVGTDVPSYLGDYNGDMSKIDKAIGDVANSQGSVEQSVVGLTAEVQELSTQVSGVSTSVQQVQTSVAQIDTAYKQADSALSQRITTNANNIQTNTTAIESANTAIESANTSIENINTTIGTEDISGIGDGTIKGAISNINSNLSGLNIKTLWTNQELNGNSNLSQFNPQTININGISEYDIIGICHSANNKTSTEFNLVLNIPNKKQVLNLTYSDASEGYNFAGYNRVFTILENGISFEDAYSSLISSRSKNNSYAIPIKIIGIKL